MRHEKRIVQDVTTKSMHLTFCRRNWYSLNLKYAMIKPRQCSILHAKDFAMMTSSILHKHYNCLNE